MDLDTVSRRHAALLKRLRTEAPGKTTLVVMQTPPTPTVLASTLNTSEKSILTKIPGVKLLY
jgi:hypothetical protein